MFLSIALKGVFVVVQMHEVAPIGQRLVLKAINHVKGHLATTTRPLTIVPATIAHAIAAPVIIVEWTDPTKIRALRKIVVS